MVKSLFPPEWIRMVTGQPNSKYCAGSINAEILVDQICHNTKKIVVLPRDESLYQCE